MMNFALFAAVLTLFPMIMNAAQWPVYLGARGGIFLTTLDGESGQLTAPKLVGEVENPSFLAIRDRQLVCVAEKKIGAVVSWKIEGDGRLTKINEQPSNGAEPCAIDISPSGRFVLIANYSSGSVASYPLAKDGTLGAQISFVELTGSGPNPKRQIHAYAHGIYCDATEKWVFVTDLGSDKVWVFHLQSDGVLTLAGSASLPPGDGPRHLAFGAEGKHLYVNGEMGLDLTTLDFDAATGSLKTVAATPAFPKGMELDPKADTAEVVVHPNGKFLYLSTRGTSSISLYSIAGNGSLTFLENVLTPVQGPRHFSLSPDGKWLVVPGQKDGRIGVFFVDPETGKLSVTANIVELLGPACAVFAE